MGGVSASSPPSPMISGTAMTKPTVRPFLFFVGRCHPWYCRIGGPSTASGSRCAAVSIGLRVNAGFGAVVLSVEGLRKSTRSAVALGSFASFEPDSFLKILLFHLD